MTPPITTDRRKAEAWMLQGIRQHELFNRNFTAARQNAVNAGLFFLSAHTCVADGDWSFFLSSYAQQLKPRVVYFHMQLAREALEWARSAHPELSGKKLEEMATAMVMQSPKPLIALCRELGHMRKFGEYDAVKYAAKNRLTNGSPQLELEFGDVIKWLEPLEHFGDSNFRLVPPEGKSERQCLEELDARFEAIRTRVRAQLKDLIDT